VDGGNIPDLQKPLFFTMTASKKKPQHGEKTANAGFFHMAHMKKR